MDDISKCYEILGLKIGASMSEVREAYKDLVKVWHPDRFVNDPAMQEKAHRKMSEINSAFSKIQEFLAHLDAYQQATRENQKTTTSHRPSETPHVPPMGGVKSSRRPPSSRGVPQAMASSASFLPLSLLVAAFIGSYGYLSFSDKSIVNMDNVEAFLYLCGRIIGLTIFPIVPTLIYYKTRSNRAKSWAVGLSGVQVVITVFAVANTIKESHQSKEMPSATASLVQRPALDTRALANAERERVETPSSAAPPEANVPTDPDAQRARATQLAQSKNFIEAAKWFRLAANQGDAFSQAILGGYYFYGMVGVPQDYSEAAKWLQLAAGQGEMAAQILLGPMYYNGMGVRQDYSEAAKWFRLAALQGDEKSQRTLGGMYARGLGVPQDYTEAARWLNLAAGQGDKDSQYMLGLAYAAGIGVRQSPAEAAKWFRLAAAQGHSDALAALNALGKQD